MIEELELVGRGLFGPHDVPLEPTVETPAEAQEMPLPTEICESEGGTHD